jgi:hypothetical protein
MTNDMVKMPKRRRASTLPKSNATYADEVVEPPIGIFSGIPSKNTSPMKSTQPARGYYPIISPQFNKAAENQGAAPRQK